VKFGVRIFCGRWYHAVATGPTSTGLGRKIRKIALRVLLFSVDGFIYQCLRRQLVLFRGEEAAPVPDSGGFAKKISLKFGATIFFQEMQLCLGLDSLGNHLNS
jgi:hypothetical protein